MRNWIRQNEADLGKRDDRPTTQMIEENRRLRAENKELRRVNEVLRAASAPRLNTNLGIIGVKPSSA